MFFRVSKTRGVFQRVQFDKNGALVPALDYQLRKSEQAPPEQGYTHTPENDVQLHEFKRGQYGRKAEGGLFDIFQNGVLWGAFSPIFIADDANFSASTQPMSPNGWFGDGSDGNITLDGIQGATNFLSVDSSTQYSLTRDVFFANLTINSGITLKPKGFKIFVNGILTNNGTITGSGLAGGDGARGGDGDLTTSNGSKGGVGGTSGDNVPDGSIGAGSPFTAISNAVIQNANLLWITTTHDIGNSESRRIVVSGITGITGANGTFSATKVDGTRLALVGSFSGSYISGGTWYNHVHGGQGGTGQDGVGAGTGQGTLVTGYASPVAAASGEGGSKIQYGIGAAGSNGDAGGVGGSTAGGGGGLASAVQSTNPFETYRTSITNAGFSGMAYGDIDELFSIILGRITPLQNGATPLITLVRAQGFPGGGGAGAGGGTVNGSNPARAGGGGGGGGSGASGVPVFVFAWRIVGAGSINSDGMNGGKGGDGGNAVTSNSASPACGGGGGAAGSGGNGGITWVGYTYLDPLMIITAKHGTKGSRPGNGGTGVGTGSANGSNGGPGFDGADGYVRLYKFF